VSEPAAPGPFIHRFRPGPDASAPTLLLLHGTGGDENDLLPLGAALAEDAALLSPRGQVSEHGAARWFRRLAEGVFDMDDLVRRTNQLADFVTAAIDHYRLEPSSVIAVGFSNGANIAAALLLLHPRLLRAAVLLAPMVPLADPPRADLSAVAVFIGAGRNDPIAPPEQAEALAGMLSDRRAAVQLHYHPDGHMVDRATVGAAGAWLHKLLAASILDSLP
jgi:phospholipase/carboxylesterase